MSRIHGPLYPPEIRARREKWSKDDERREQIADAVDIYCEHCLQKFAGRGISALV